MLELAYVSAAKLSGHAHEKVLFVSAISGTLITFTEGRDVCHTSTYNFTIVQNLQAADAKSTRRLLTGEVAD